MNKRLWIATTALAVTAAAAGGALAATHDDEQATGPGADRARTAALAATSGGRANSVERDDENGAFWEVEVTKPDGRTVDVRLAKNLKVVVIEGDSDSSEGKRDR